MLSFWTEKQLIILFINSSIGQINMKSLQDFASNDNHQLFTQAKSLPSFFQHNLVDPARVVKVFHSDPQANIRIFYYQYLKLCFQLDNVNYEFYINKIQQIINNQDFKFIFYEDDDPSLFSDLQFKNLIMQFFGILGDGNITIDAALTRYPVMDTVFIYFFRAFLILTGKAQNLDSFIERDQLLQYLCSYFQIEISVHDKCIKFVETDIFAYEEDPKQVFMAFMDYDRVQNDSQLETPSQDIPNFLQQTHQKHEDNNQFIPSHGQGSKIVQPVKNRAEEYLQDQAKAKQLQSTYNFPKVKLDEAELGQMDYTFPASNSSRRDNNQGNQSYISNQFIDYTSGVNYNLAGLEAKDSFKDSDSLNILKHNQSSNIKTDQFSYNLQQIAKIPASKPSGFKFEQESQPIFTSYESKIHSINYGLNSELERSSYQNGSFNNLSHYMTKTNYSMEVLPTKKTELEENNKYVAQNDWQPTKDPGFIQKYSTNQYVSSATYQKPVSPSSSFQPYSNTSYDPTDYLKAMEKKKPIQQIISTPDSLKQFQGKKSSSFDLNPLPVMTYTPTYQTSSFQSSFSSNYATSSPFQNQYSGQVGMSKVGSGTNPFGLNVSLEFTNSFTMKAMNEPYRSNVSSIRQRARNFRNSLASYLK